MDKTEKTPQIPQPAKEAGPTFPGIASFERAQTNQSPESGIGQQGTDRNDRPPMIW